MVRWSHLFTAPSLARLWALRARSPFSTLQSSALNHQRESSEWGPQASSCSVTWRWAGSLCSHVTGSVTQLSLKWMSQQSKDCQTLALKF